MRNLHKLLGIIAVGALVIASGFCDPAPVVDPALAGKWYLLPTFAMDDGDRGLVYEFKADGKFRVGTKDFFDEYSATFSASNNKITMHVPGDPDTPANYVINQGTQLIITQPAGKTSSNTGWVAGTYYKKAAMDPVILGRWFGTQSGANGDDGTTSKPTHEFKADGTYSKNGALATDSVFWASNGKLIAVYSDPSKTNFGNIKSTVTYAKESATTIRLSALPTGGGMGGIFLTGLHYKK